MTNKTFFKLRGIISLIAALIILVGSLFIPTVKFTVIEPNGLEDNGTFLTAITRIANLEKAHGKSDELIAAKYGKYLEVAAKQYKSLGKNTSNDLFSEIKPAYKEWSNSENVDFQNLDLSTFKGLDPYTKASFYYYVILSGQKELENLDNPDKLYYVKALENSGVNIKSYKNKIENHIKTCREELKKVIDEFDTGYENTNGFSYSFSFPAPVWFIANTSEIKNLSELFSKENNIYDKNIAIDSLENALQDKQLLKPYYETEYENSTNALKELMSTLGYDLSDIENNFNTANSQITGAQTLIDEANTERSEMKEQRTSIETLISEKQELIATTVREINELQAQTAAKQAPIVALQWDIDEINRKIEDYNNAIEDLKALLTVLGYDVDNDTYEDESIITIIQNDIDNKQALIAAAQTKLTEKEQEIITKQSEIQTEIDDLNIQISEKQNQIISETTQIYEYNAQIDEYNAQIAEKYEFIKEKETFISTANTFHNFLDYKAQELVSDKKQELNEIQAPIVLLRQEIAEIQATVQEYKNAVNYLKSLNNKFALNVEDEITYAQKLIDLLNGKITDYNNEIGNLENELREQITTKNNEINNLNAAVEEFNALNRNIINTTIDIEKTEASIATFTADKLAIENEIAENYEKYANSFNDVSFYFAMYYRESSFTNDQEIVDNPHLYYELYRGTTHTIGLDTGTFSYLSLAVLFLAGSFYILLFISIIIQTIKLICKKQSLYPFGLIAFVRTMTIWIIATVLTIMFNTLSFGTGTLSVFGIFLALICITILAFNSVCKRHERITYTGKAIINLVHVFSIIEIVLLSFALGTFILGNITTWSTSIVGDFISFRKRAPSSITASFIFALPTIAFIVVALIYILNTSKTLGMVQQNFGRKTTPYQHISSAFGYSLLIVILSCAIIMLVLLIAFTQTFSTPIWKQLAVIMLVSLTLVAQIIQNKLLKKHFPLFTVNDMSEILNIPTSASPN